MSNTNIGIDYFVIGHDPAALCNTGHDILPDMKYLLVGQHHLKTDKNYIIPQLLRHNIEYMNNLCSYTAWYAICKNLLYSNKSHITLLEYDTAISRGFHDLHQKTILDLNYPKHIIAYSYTNLDHYVFYKSTPWLEICLKDIHNIDLMDFVDRYKHKYPIWPTTTNITMPPYILHDFINWFHPMAEMCHNHPLAAYVHERAFFIYCVLHNIRISYLPNVLRHKQLQSHNIEDIYGGFLKSQNTHIFLESMRPLYDIAYHKAYRSIIEKQ